MQVVDGRGTEELAHPLEGDGHPIVARGEDRVPRTRGGGCNGLQKQRGEGHGGRRRTEALGHDGGGEERGANVVNATLANLPPSDLMGAMP